MPVSSYNNIEYVAEAMTLVREILTTPNATAMSWGGTSAT